MLGNKARAKGWEFAKRLEMAQSQEVFDEMVRKARRGGFNWRVLVPRITKGLEFKMPASVKSNKGTFVLSIQADCFHRCEPTLTLTNYDKYESFDVSLLRNGNLWGLKALLGEDDKLTKEFEKYAVKDATSYGFVPGDLVERLYQRFKEDCGEIETH